MRLDKFLTENQIGTRSQVKEYIKNGLVTVNQQVIVKTDAKVVPESDVITFRKRIIKYEPFVYYMLHKPAGVVTATTDNLHPTVMELLKAEKRIDLFPVGRLDKDTEGLLLITNDGEWAHNLLSPKKKITKTYIAQIDTPITKEEATLMENGLYIGDEKKTLPAKITILKDQEVELTITEGRFHQVKRMFEAVNKKVNYLKRISVGCVSLDDDLEKGSYRKLTAEEIANVVKQLGKVTNHGSN